MISDHRLVRVVFPYRNHYVPRVTHNSNKKKASFYLFLLAFQRHKEPVPHNIHIFSHTELHSPVHAAGLLLAWPSFLIFLFEGVMLSFSIMYVYPTDHTRTRTPAAKTNNTNYFKSERKENKQRRSCGSSEAQQS